MPAAMSKLLTGPAECSHREERVIARYVQPPFSKAEWRSSCDCHVPLVPIREKPGIHDRCVNGGSVRGVLNFLSCDHRPTRINSERRSGVRNRKNYGKNQKNRKACRLPRPRRTQTNRIRRQTKQRRKIRLAGVPPKVARARRSLNFGDFYICTYCLQVIRWDHHRTRPTKDHFFPKSKKKLLMGVKTTIIICCQPCNSRKSDKVFSTIEEVREFITSRKKALR